MNNNQAIFANLIRQQASSHANAELLTFVHIDRQGQFVEETREYRQLWSNGQRIARALFDRDMRRGDHFALMMHNHPEFVDAMVASSILGTVFVPIDPQAHGDRLAYLLDFSECRGAIVADYALPAILEVIDKVPRLQWLLVIPSATSKRLPAARMAIDWLVDALPSAEPRLDVAVTDPAEPMQLLFTSGTTGDPKALVFPYERFDKVVSLAADFGIVGDDRLYTGLSLTHANAQLITLGISLKLGIPGIISRKFSKSRLWEICRRYQCTIFNLLGGMTTAIYSEPLLSEDAHNPVRMVLSGGMPAAIWEGFEQRFDLRVFEIYGASEGGNTFNPPGVGPMGSIGKPPAGLVARIVDEDGRECERGEHGEIVFRNTDGTCDDVAYFKNPEASASKTSGGWLHMGDIGYRDKDGWLFFAHRKGLAIRHNGEFIDTAHVEKTLAEHVWVDDVFVYGIPAASGAPGEKDIIAAVVAAPDIAWDDSVLIEHCRRVLGANSVPSRIQRVAEIPKTSSEKPRDQDCLALLQAETIPESLAI